MEQPKKVGRPSKFNDRIARKIIELSESGKTTEQIAEIIGIHASTLYLWWDNKPEFLEAVREAKQAADELVEASLFRRAVGYSHPEQKCFSDGDGGTIWETVTKHYPPSEQAAIFWLKNRQPEEWREKSEVDTTVKVTSNTGDWEFKKDGEE